MISQFVYALFSLLDDVLSVSCIVWLCWQFPVVGRRPVRAFFVVMALLFVSPMISALGRTLTYWGYPGVFADMYVWSFLWSMTALPYWVLAMLWIRRVSGIAVTKNEVAPPPRPPLAVSDLFLWTLVAAVGFAFARAVEDWLTGALMRLYGTAQMSGAAMMGYAAFQTVVYGAVVYLLLPNLRSSIWKRALLAFVVIVLARVSILVIYYSVHVRDQPPPPPSYWFEVALTSVTSVLGILLAFQLLQRRGYAFQFQSKRSDRP